MMQTKLGLSTSAAMAALKRVAPTPAYWGARRAYFALWPAKRKEHRAEVKFYAELIAPGDLCFDIGCHLGRKAKALLACGARVIGVEPLPVAQRMLELEFRREERFELVPRGVAAEPGTMTLHQGATLAMTSFKQDWPVRRVGSFDVPVTTLDRLIETYGRPAYCKIDVEGFELQVLEGLSSAIPLISFECHRREAATALRCLGRLGKLGNLRVNVSPMEEARFLFPEFISVREFEQQLENWPNSVRGDVYVRTQ